jgi:hypothetical protein
MSSATPGGLTPDQIRWDERHQALEFESLPNIRATAKQWAASIGAVTGVFGLVALIKGREDIGELGEWWARIVYVLILLALLAALGAIVSAALAAQGTPQELGSPASKWRKLWLKRAGVENMPETLPPSGAGLRVYYNVEPRIALLQLRLSRQLAVAAALLTMAAIGITWLGPAEEASAAKVLVVKTDGSFACGDLTSGKASTVNVLAKKGAMPTEISIADVLAVHSVAKCP